MQTEETLYRKLLELIAPKTILKDFELIAVKEKNSSIILFLKRRKRTFRWLYKAKKWYVQDLRTP